MILILSNFFLSLFLSSPILFLPPRLFPYYKELKRNWRRALFNRSCINDDDMTTTTTTTKLQHVQIPKASMQRKQTFIRLIRSFVCSLARICSTYSSNRWQVRFSAISKRRSWPIWSSIHKPYNHQAPTVCWLRLFLPHPNFPNVPVRGLFAAADRRGMLQSMSHRMIVIGTCQLPA